VFKISKLHVAMKNDLKKVVTLKQEFLFQRLKQELVQMVTFF